MLVTRAALVFWLTCSVSGAPSTANYAFEFTMPGVQPQQPDTYLCHGLDVGDQDVYITEFRPRAEKDVAHHILLYGCEEPGSMDSVWNCGEMAARNSQYSAGSVCAHGSQILYAWAMDAPKLTLPKDVAFKVGGQTGIKSLVLQVHYKNVSSFLEPNQAKDYSGLTITATDKPQKRRAGVYLMVTGGRIPAHSVEYLESACPFPDPAIEIHPFAFRTHAHKLGRVVSGYRVRDQKWEEIGRMDPRKPQMFYGVADPKITVRNGDILAARCTMENTSNKTVNVGSTQNDEMCNFYIMYYVDGDRLLDKDICFTPGAPSWYWQEYPEQQSLNVAGAPSTVSVVPGSGRLLNRTTVADAVSIGGQQNTASEGKTTDDAEEAAALDEWLDAALASMASDEVEDLVAEALDDSPNAVVPGYDSRRLASLNRNLYPRGLF